MAVQTPLQQEIVRVSAQSGIAGTEAGGGRGGSLRFGVSCSPEVM